MPPIEQLPAFVLAATLLALAPGPDNCFVLACAASRGRLAGLAVTAGLCTGLLVHSAAVALGLAGLLRASPTAFVLIETAGAGYLLFLAWQAFRGEADDEATTGTGAAGSWWRLYRRGIIMNLTNPKVALFFLAFLPSFAVPEAGAMATQLLVLGACFVSATILVFGAIALLAGSLGERIGRSTGAQRRLQRMAGGVFIALAIHILLG